MPRWGSKAVAVCLFTLLCGAVALAQNYAEVARNTGYRDGAEKGRNDAAQGKSYNPERHDAWRDADHGYRGSFGNKEDYRRIYREAFVSGYREGYQGGRSRRPYGGEDRPGRQPYGREERPSQRPYDREERPGWVAEPARSAFAEAADYTGYRDGLEKGRNDAAQGKSYNPERHDAYRDADHGYRDSFGNKQDYRQKYREAFLRGYRESYQGGQRGWQFGRDERRGQVFPQTGAGYAEVARNTGYRDGLEKGRSDARQRKSYNPERHDAYRDADHGYRDSFGNKQDYRQQYREAFLSGYREGYRGSR